MVNVLMSNMMPKQDMEVVGATILSGFKAKPNCLSVVVSDAKAEVLVETV